MATKSKPKSNVSRNKKSPIKFHWWMAAILVIVVAVIGIAVLRFSRASGPTVSYNASQFANLPNFEAQKGAFLTVDKSSAKGPIPVYRLKDNSSSILFYLQLYPGKYVVCAWGKGLSNGSDIPSGGDSGLMAVQVSVHGTQAQGRTYQNLTSGYTPTNRSICVDFDNYNSTSTSLLILKNTSASTGAGADINAVTIEAKP